MQQQQRRDGSSSIRVATRKPRIGVAPKSAISLSLVVIGAGVSGCSSDGSGVDSAIDEEFRGRVVTSIARYPDDTSRTFQRLVVADGRTFELGARGITAPSGSEVVVRGVVEGKALQVTSYDFAPYAESSAALERRAPLSGAGVLTNAFLVLDDTYSVESARQRLLEDTDSPKTFYAENSWDSWILEGDAFGPYSVPTGACGNVTDIQVIEKDASDAAKAAGVPLDDFDNVLIYLPDNVSCSWSGWGDMGHPLSSKNGFKNGRYSLYHATDGCVVLTQELGHNYGLGHSHFCTAPPYSVPAFEDGGNGAGCAGHSEYGDPFTPMARGCGHFNAVEKGEMKFIGGCNILHIAANGTFDLVPIETKTTETQVLRVAAGEANSGPQFVYVEYRKARVSSDTQSEPGIYFHAGPDLVTLPNTGNPDPERVWASDPILISPSGAAASAYLDSGEWTEPASGATFKVVSLGDKATLDVTFPNAGGDPPTCMDSGSGGAGGIGGSSGAGGAGGSAGTAGTAGTTGGTSGAGGAAGSGGAAGTGGGAGAGNGGSGGAAGNSGSGGAGAVAGSSGASGGQAGAGSSSNTDGGMESGCACEVARSSVSQRTAWGGLVSTLLLGWVGRRRSAARRVRARADELQ